MLDYNKLARAKLCHIFEIVAPLHECCIKEVRLYSLSLARDYLGASILVCFLKLRCEVHEPLSFGTSVQTVFTSLYVCSPGFEVETFSCVRAFVPTSWSPFAFPVMFSCSEVLMSVIASLK